MLFGDIFIAYFIVNASASCNRQMDFSFQITASGAFTCSYNSDRSKAYDCDIFGNIYSHSIKSKLFSDILTY